ncbi:MAG TPA: BA14K family protein [Rhizobiaceae bacterium]|nr:BA14K family protein [Rhizobiaceae bacterium]
MAKPIFAPILAMIGGFVLAAGMFAGGLLFAVLFFMPGEPARDLGLTENVADVWTNVPKAVDAGVQAYERVEPVADPGKKTSDAANDVEGAGIVREANAGKREGAPNSGVVTIHDGKTVTTIDTMTTAAVPAVAEEPTADEAVDNPAAARLLQAHQDWCARRYRSYDASTNSYSPYAGGRRDCFSPYVAEYAALTGADAPFDPNVRFAPLADEESGVIEAAVGEAFAVEQDGFGVDDANGYTVIDDQHIRNCFSRYQSYRPEDNTYQPYGGGPRRVCE